MANEKRLIDAVALRNQVMNEILHYCNCGEGGYYFAEDVIPDVDNAPTVDAVEVVRCRDCKHWHEETGWCNQHSHFVDIEGGACHPWESSEWKMFVENDFCSYGERRNDGNGRSDQ